MMQNLTTSILRSYFAKWSFQYNSPFANTSKILEPISGYIGAGIEKAAQYFSMQYRNTALEVSDTIYLIRSGETRIKASAEQWSIKKKDGSFETGPSFDMYRLGDYESKTFSQFPISGGAFVFVDEPIRKNFICKAGETYVNITFPRPAKVYVYPSEKSNNNIFCYIYGNDNDGEIITEKVRIYNGKIASESIYAYKNILKVVSDADVDMATYVDCDMATSIESDISFPKRFVRLDGENTTPYIAWDKKEIGIYDQFDPHVKADIYYDVDSEIKKCFLTANMDVIHLDENGWLVATKPAVDYSVAGDINGSMVDERFLMLDNNKTTVGEQIVASFYPYKFASEFRTSQVRISVENNGTVLYLNRYGQLTPEPDTYIEISSMNDIVRVGVICENERPYIFRVRADSGEYVCAMAYQFEPNIRPIIGGVEDMFIYNGELIIVRGDNYVFIPSRMGYMTYGGDSIAFDSEYRGLKIE